MSGRATDETGHVPATGDHDESGPREATDEVGPALSRAITAMEDIDWAEVPTISTAEAATFANRLIEAREAVQRPDSHNRNR